MQPGEGDLRSGCGDKFPDWEACLGTAAASWCHRLSGARASVLDVNAVFVATEVEIRRAGGRLRREDSDWELETVGDWIT